VSGSDQYKKEYDRLKEERDKASSSVLINIQKKKGVTAEKSQLKMQKKEQKEYNDALDLLAEEQQKYIMWRLYHIEKV
jgi:structural maintenance of chromosome 1